MHFSTPIQDLRGALFQDRYEIMDHVGRGRMGDVFLAHDHTLDRRVALKVLLPELSDDEAFVTAVSSVMAAAERLRHQGIVSIYDWGRDEGDFYIVMEYVEGKSLSELLMLGALTPERAAQIGAKTAAVLGFAHRRGVVHGDISSSDILVGHDGSIKLCDFGMAMVHPSNDAAMEGRGIISTAAYLSPERASGIELDQRSDVYSLGVVLYEMATGDVPFRGESTIDVALKHVAEEPLPLRMIDSSIPAMYESIVMRALAKAPANRYQTALLLRDDLTRLEAHESEARAQANLKLELQLERESELERELEMQRKPEPAFRQPIHERPRRSTPVSRKRHWAASGKPPTIGALIFALLGALFLIQQASGSTMTETKTSATSPAAQTANSVLSPASTPTSITVEPTAQTPLNGTTDPAPQVMSSMMTPPPATPTNMQPASGGLAGHIAPTATGPADPGTTTFQVYSSSGTILLQGNYSGTNYLNWVRAQVEINPSSENGYFAFYSTDRTAVHQQVPFTVNNTSANPMWYTDQYIVLNSLPAGQQICVNWYSYTQNKWYVPACKSLG